MPVIVSSPPRAPKPAWFSALSFLAPAAWVVLPAMALAFAPGDKDEAYEWTQHRLAAAVFAGGFASVLLRGCWRPGKWTGWAAVSVLTVLAGLVVRGLPGTHFLFVVAGGLVSLGYWRSTRDSPSPPLEVAAVGFSSAISFWAVSRLAWWQTFEILMGPWANRIIFLAATALLVWCLDRIARSAASGDERHNVSRALDVLILAVLAAAVLRTNPLVNNFVFSHHWSVYTAPADLVRDGRHLLGDVPSQYGFLLTLVVAWLPAADTFTALYWLTGGLIWVSGAIIYFTLRTWLSHWAWQIGAGAIAVSTVAFLCGDASLLTGPLVYPSTGALRFIWVHALLGFLVWRHRAGRPAAPGGEPDRRAVWIGSGLWLGAVLWSVESAAYVTAAWFPAGAILAMKPAPTGAGWSDRLRALLGGIGGLLLVTGFLLATALILIGACYWGFLGRMPEWKAYWEYATAFSQGFGVLPIEPWGGVWALLLLHATLLAAVVSFDVNRDRPAVVLIWAAWGALWAVSTYYVSRSHTNNITNLSPVLLLVVGVTVHALRPSAGDRLARAWTWLAVPPFVGAMLWLVLTNPPGLRSQLGSYAVEPRPARLLPARPPELAGLIEECLARRPGPWVAIGAAMYEVKIDRDRGQTAWLPVGSLPLLAPLSVPTRIAYLEKYRRNQAAGWLIAPVEQYDPGLAWLFDYLNERYVMQISFTRKHWVAWYYTPRFTAPDQPAGQK